VSTKLGLVGCKTPAPTAWSVYKTVVDNANEAVAGVDTTYGTVSRRPAQRGAHLRFHFNYTVTPTQNGHTHTLA